MPAFDVQEPSKKKKGSTSHKFGIPPPDTFICNASVPGRSILHDGFRWYISRNNDSPQIIAPRAKVSLKNMLAWNAKIPGFSVDLKLQKYTPILVGKSKNSKDKQIYHKIKVSELQHDMRTQSMFESAQTKKRNAQIKKKEMQV